MAFCTSCGATLDSNAQFCVKCGARQAVGVGGAAPAPASGGGALKIVLIVVAGVILLSVVGSVATMIFVGKRLHDAKVSIREHGGEATVETPMGTVHTTKDPAKIAENLGVDIYPGAKAIEGGSEVQTMGMRTVTGIFETSDPVDKVGDFYHEKYPKGIYTATDRETSIITGSQGSMVTIHIKDDGGKTKLTIVNMAGKGVRAPGAPEPPEPPEPPRERTN
ncbi:MAG TPA: zinc ribbon domain-containing protein [Terriglobales bacterium]|nr:zinc ribbon domain-containing protein [Terriglobales bacterium]